MTRLIPRAIVGAIVALIAFTILGAIVLLIYAGVPRPGAEAGIIDKAADMAPIVSLALGILILLAAGWWAARPFVRTPALICAGLLGLIFIGLNLAIDYSYGGISTNFWTDIALPILLKLLAAIAGGWLGARRGDEIPPIA